MGMTWREICTDPVLSQLPQRVESNEWGNAVIRPMPTAWHSFLQSQVIFALLHLLPHGRAQPAYAMQTSKGVKGIDIVWLSDERRKHLPKRALVCPLAPEICVEVLVAKNVRAEFLAKNLLYFERGAQESWICDHSGKLTVFDVTGQIAQSELCPEFPRKNSAEPFLVKSCPVCPR